MQLASVLLRRLDDPANEYRRIDVYQDGPNFSYWEEVFFASNQKHSKGSMVKMGGESLIKEEVRKEIGRLCSAGFVVTSGDNATFVTPRSFDQGF